MLFIFIFIIITSCSSLYPINEEEIELFKLNKHCELRPYHPKFLLIFLMMKLVLSKKKFDYYKRGKSKEKNEPQLLKFQDMGYNKENTN